MVKEIAVLMGTINVGNQKRLLDGMIDAARETGCNIFVFTCNIKFDEKEENKQTAHQIMKLPDFHCFDGVIIVRNTIEHDATAEEVIAAIRESGTPAVSIDCELSGMDYVGFMRYEAQYEIVQHLVEVHGCRDICYIAGTSFGGDTEAGLRAYRDVLEENGIAYHDKNVIKPDQYHLGGKGAAECLLEQRECPEAIVCASDLLAAEVLEVLKKHGYRVPEDVLVTGFDAGKISMLLDPPLTTVDTNLYGAGREAVLSLLDLKKMKPRRRLVPFRAEFRTSCGCHYADGSAMRDFKVQHRRDDIRIIKVSDILIGMISDFTEAEQPDELIEALKTYVPQMDIESFYLCLCDTEEIFGVPSKEMNDNVAFQQVNGDYTSEMSIPLAYEDGKFHAYGAFPRGMVLPAERRGQQGGNFYIATPIYYRQYCFGYCVTRNSRFPIEEMLYYMWMINIGIGLENIRKLMLLREVIERLNRVWAFDMLTNLYNRAGFFDAAAPLLESLHMRGAEAFLIFMDIDGLKAINDTRGHEMGDLLIKTTAGIVQASIREGELAMRYGGDEFVIVGEQQNGRMEELKQKINAGMEEWNRIGSGFTVSASIGGTCFVAEDVNSLGTRIEQADMHMYQEKKERKKRKD